MGKRPWWEHRNKGKKVRVKTRQQMSTGQRKLPPISLPNFDLKEFEEDDIEQSNTERKVSRVRK